MGSLSANGSYTGRTGYQCTYPVSTDQHPSEPGCRMLLSPGSFLYGREFLCNAGDSIHRTAEKGNSRKLVNSVGKKKEAEASTPRPGLA
jgi:hypothetical protein